MRKLITWIRRRNATCGLTRELNPPLLLPVTFRAYEPRDFDPLMSVYQLNAPGRFPAGQEDQFSSCLKKEPNGIFVGELNGKTICCAGLVKHGPDIYTFCYGLVHPQFHRQRIGSTLTLLRILATGFGDKADTLKYAMINAVPSSLSFYQRFEFRERKTWGEFEGLKYPHASLLYTTPIIREIAAIYKWRKIKIQGGFQPSLDPKQLELKTAKNDQGAQILRFIPLNQPDEKPNPSMPA